MNNIKVIFLDIDGVLNQYNNFTKQYVYLLIKKFNKKHHFFGVRNYLMKRVATIVKKTDAVIVLSASIRAGYKYTPESEKTNRQKELSVALRKNKLKIYDITDHISTERSDSDRGAEILYWLSKHPEVTHFVILDDEVAQLEQFKNKELIRTSKSDVICGAFSEHTGIKRKHVRQAIKILMK